jgi:N-acetylglucosamine kinase-like BadF-type ATPase
MGLEGIRAAYQALEHGPNTGLLGSLVEHYRPFEHDASRGDRSAAVREIARNLAALGTASKPTIASFAQRVTRQAELGDGEAERIVKKGASDLASAASRVYRELALGADPRPVPPRFLLSGSVASRSESYKEAFRASLAKLMADVSDRLEDGLDVTIQVNGLSEAMMLARRLAEDVEIGIVDREHGYSVLR